VDDLPLHIGKDLHRQKPIEGRSKKHRVITSDLEFKIAQMKHTPLKTQVFIILSLLFSIIGNIATVEAQVPVVTEMIPFPDGPDRQAYVVTIPIGELKKISNHWDDYVGNDAYGWETQKDGIHGQRGVMEKNISSRKFAVYNEIVTTELGVRLTIWFSQRRKPFTATKPGDKLDIAIKKYIQDFAIDQYKRGIQTQLKYEQHLKREMEMELASLKRDQENPKHAIGDGEFQLQTAAANKSIEAHNVKMQELLDTLSAIQK